MVATDTNGSRRDAIWIIPCERIKAPREHRVPLPAGAQNLSARRNKVRPYVFSTAPMAEKPMSNMNMAMLLRRADMGHVTVHGFRFNFRIWTAANQPPREVCEHALAHQLPERSKPPTSGRTCWTNGAH